MAKKLVLGVLGSTRGTDMQAIMDAIESGKLDAKIAIVVSDKPLALILEKAKAHGIIYKGIGYKGNFGV